MGKFLKFVVVPVLFIIGFLFVIPFFISTDDIREAAEQAATEASGMEVSIQELSFQLLPTPKLAVQQLSFTDDKAGVPRAVIASGKLSLETDALLDGRVDIKAINCNDIDLRVSEQASGKQVHVIHIRRLTGSVQLTEDRLDLTDWRAYLYEGVVSLNASVASLQSASRTIKAEIHGEDIQMQPLLSDVSGKQNLAGRFETDLDISSFGGDELAWQRNLKVDGPVYLKDGSIEGFGLEGAAAALVHGRLASGPMLFEMLEFQFRMRGKKRQLNEIVLNSSHLDASGFVHISAAGAMQGEIETTGTSGLSGAKFMVAGTTDKPKVMPAPSSLLGGAIGGAVGGPVGAAIGAKAGGKAGGIVEGAGGAIRGIFGK